MSEGLKFGILHWGPCVVKTKADQATLDLLLSEGEASKEDASPELAGVLNNQFHYRDKNKFSKFMEGTFNLYNHAISKWKLWPKENVPGTYYLEKLWINFQGPNEFNPPHSHGGALSFVIFAKVPTELRVENQNYKDYQLVLVELLLSMEMLKIDVFQVILFFQKKEICIYFLHG